jgi:hypothetical protein
MIRVSVPLAVFVSGAACLGGPNSVQVTPRPASSGTPPVSGPPVSRPAEVNVFHAGAGSYDVAYGLGAVWVATGRGVSKLDPSTGRVIGRADLHNRSEWSNLTVADGSVWFLGANAGGWMVARVNPRTMRANRPTRLPYPSGTAYEGIAVAGGVVCVGRIQRRPVTVCVSTRGGRRLLVPLAGRSVGVAGFAPRIGAEGKIWIGGPSLTQFDPSTRSISAVDLPPGGNVAALAAGGSTVWAVLNIRDRPSQVWTIVGGRVDHRVVIQEQGVAALAVWHGSVWVMTEGARPRVAAMRPDGSLAFVAVVPADEHTLAASPAALWAARYRTGTVVRVTRTPY